jgi:hypothetical protein
MSGLERYDWSELASVPEAPGVYAWYCRPVLAVRDVETVIENSKQYQLAGEADKAETLLKDFLDRFLFRLFQEDPFKAELSGPLKPSFYGELAQQIPTSASLARRLVENPERLRTIQTVLDRAAPDFASPIYIGMSSNLRNRLQQHKSWIQRYRDGSANSAGENDTASSFALQVVRRGMRPERLFVNIRTVSSDADTTVDIENILNRICYPILGRN